MYVEYLTVTNNFLYKMFILAQTGHPAALSTLDRNAKQGLFPHLHWA